MICCCVLRVVCIIGMLVLFTFLTLSLWELFDVVIFVFVFLGV